MVKTLAALLSLCLSAPAPATAGLAATFAEAPKAAAAAPEAMAGVLNVRQRPLTKAQETLLYHNRYQIRSDGTVWSPDGVTPVSPDELSDVLRRLGSNERLKALLQIDLVLSNSAGEKYLTPAERGEVRRLARGSWPFFTLALRKSFRGYFTGEELERLNADPAPVSAADDSEPLKDPDVSQLPPPEPETRPQRAAVPAPWPKLNRAAPVAVLSAAPEPARSQGAYAAVAALVAAPPTPLPAAPPVPAPAVAAPTTPPPAPVAPVAPPAANQEFIFGKDLRRPAAESVVTGPTTRPAAPPPAAAPAAEKLSEALLAGLPAGVSLSPGMRQALLNPPAPKPAPPPAASTAAGAAPAPAPAPKPAPKLEPAAPLPAGPLAPPPVADVVQAEFERWLVEAPYGREAKDMLRLISEKTPAFVRARALNAVLAAMPMITIDPGRGDLDRHAVILADERPGETGYTIVLNPGPAFYTRKRTFFGSITIMLAEAPGAFAAMHLPVPGVAALRKGAVAAKEEDGPWGRTRTFADGSQRSFYSPEQLAGTLLRQLILLDARRQEWEADRLAAELYARSAQFMFYAKLVDERRDDRFLDPDLRQDFHEWLEHPRDWRDALVHTLASSRGGGFDAKLAGPGGAEQAAREALNACPVSLAQEISRRETIRRDGLKAAAAVLREAGLLDKGQLEAAQKAIDAEPAPRAPAELCVKYWQDVAVGLRLAAGLRLELRAGEAKFRQQRGLNAAGH